MVIDAETQAKFERNLTWKRSWPRCFLAFAATLEIIIGLVIFLTELFNILTEFWHMNIFGGIWASIIIFINWILIFVTVCCRTTIGASTCALVWNIITLIALGILIAFDIIFIVNPYTCILTPTCSTQPQVISLNSLMQLIPQFKNNTSYDTKKFFLEIQVGCAGVGFIISLIYIFIFIGCRIKIRRNVVKDQPATLLAPSAPLPPPQQEQLYPVLQVPQQQQQQQQYPHYPTYPIAQAQQPVTWTTRAPYAPY